MNQDRTRRSPSAGPIAVLLAVCAGALAGCGAASPDRTAVASEAAAISPVVASSPVGAADGAFASRESAAWFGSRVLGRLVQDGFYAGDVSYLDEWVAPDHRGEVAAEIGGRVEELRWAIATLPGETERTWFVAAPLSVGVTALDPTAGDAVVEVWIVTVFSREGLGAPETRFLLETAELRWASGRWLITGLTLEPGPSVGLALDEVPISAAALDEVLSAHELIGPEVGP